MPSGSFMVGMLSPNDRPVDELLPIMKGNAHTFRGFESPSALRRYYEGMWSDFMRKLAVRQAFARMKRLRVIGFHVQSDS